MKKHTRKGISPLIAAVLLLAFTMAVASLFAQWAPDLMQQVMGDTDEDAAEVQECSRLIAEISDFNEAETAGDEEAILRQVDGSEPLGNVSVTWFYDDADPEQSFENFEGSRETIVNDNPGSSDEVERIEMSPVECEGAPSYTWES